MAELHVFMGGKDPCRLRVGSHNIVVHTGSVEDFDVSAMTPDLKVIVLGDDATEEPAPLEPAILSVPGLPSPVSYIQRPSSDEEAASGLYNLPSESGPLYLYVQARGLDPDVGALVAGMDNAAAADQVLLFSDLRAERG